MKEPTVESPYLAPLDISDLENVEEIKEYPDAKHSKYSTFESRLKTFGKKWPVVLPQQPHDLARAGFFCFRIKNLMPDGVLELVRCFYCDRLLIYWELKDDPLIEHARWHPTCPFLLSIKGEEFVKEIQKNYPSEPTAEIDDMINSENVPVSAVNLYPTSSEVSAKRFRIYLKFSNPDYPQYRQEEARLESFKDWPKNKKQQPSDLAKAGFFCDIEKGKKDQVRCFECGGGLYHWKKEEVPWIEHARYWPKCWYLYLVKGLEFIVDVRDRIRQKRLYIEDEIISSEKKCFKEEKIETEWGEDDRNSPVTSEKCSDESLTANESQNEDALPMEVDEKMSSQTELDLNDENSEPFNRSRTRQVNVRCSVSSETFERFQTYSKYSCEAFPLYKKEEERLTSFKSWPSDHIHKPDDLAKAGFFFEQRKRHGYAQVCCFDCGGKLRILRSKEDPWTDHARYYPNCQFVNFTKGVKFVLDIRNKYKPKKRK